MLQKRNSCAGLVLLLIASLLTVLSPGRAVAAESIPELQWPAVSTDAYRNKTITSPQGDVTVACDSGNMYTPQNLTTYDPTGKIVRQINKSILVDNVSNCIKNVAVDKTGTIYGAPIKGANLLAYNGNTLRWKYRFNCTDIAHQVWPTVGVNDNVYGINSSGHLIGLSPTLAFGQVQPTKVLDVAVAGRCGDELRALRNGIAHISLYDKRVTYYSYAGVKQTELTRNYVSDPQFPMNEMGWLFYPTYTGDSNTLTVSAYNPVAKKIAWSTLVSTSGYKVEAYEGSYPLPDGGVVVAVRQQKILSDGTPATPIEYDTMLVTLDYTGKKVRTQTLPGRDANGDGFGESSFAVDTKGKLVVVRELIRTEHLTARYWLPTTVITVFDTVTGDVTFRTEMKGNDNSTSGPVYGYSPVARNYTSAIGPNTLYVNAEQCTYLTCTWSKGLKLYAIKVPGLRMDYPRGVMFSRAPHPAAPYIALGDSFSSGEGVPPFASNTALPGKNTCHRSTYAYPRLIAGTSSKIPSLGSSGFRACSGAVTDNIWDVAQWNEGVQLDIWPDSTTKLVTLTVGGNDIGFASYGEACWNGRCDVGTPAYETVVGKINNELPTKLEAVYKRILKRVPNAKVYVVGYPHVIADKKPSYPKDDRCFYMYDENNPTNKWADAQAARTVVTKLNTKISEVVAKVRTQSAGNQRLQFVSTSGTGSPFKGHEVCGTSSTSWFQNVDQVVNGEAFPFHPNKRGQEGFAAVVGATINAG